MTKKRVVKKLWGYIKRTELITTVREMTVRKPKDEGLQLLNAVLKLPDDQHDGSTSLTTGVWFSALAILCRHEPTVAGKLLQTSAAASGNPINAMTKAELIDAIASHSKLTKADAG